MTYSSKEQQPASRSIDSFLNEKLADAGLTSAPPAAPHILVRRLFLDLHGLPPTPEEMAYWPTRIQQHDTGVSELIDTLLSSPRYGERMAQFWLDLVRYADTHGFEVNTSRPHAWPYRDYVIRAFNEDIPYPQFVKEQLAGDQLGVDEATGFLVAAPVLLPGQIGQDDASKRLARQDSLDEIIVSTGASFLGLTIGCARCHDHKFDPITQKDYYSLQAVYAGVEYGDRPVHDAEHQQRLHEAAELQPRLDQLNQQLQQYHPPVYPGRTILIDDEDLKRVTLLQTKNGHGENPEGTQRGYRDDPGHHERIPNVSRGRYTWWDNRPGEDVLTWNPGVSGSFRVWISWGTHGSGAHTRDARYVLDRDGDLSSTDDQQEIAQADQYSFSGQSEGESEKKPLWSGFQDAGVHEWEADTRLILRGGQSGTAITADVLLLQSVASDEFFHQGLPRLREPVSPRLNIETFPPVQARLVRFTTLATSSNNRHEPCLDELEVYTSGDTPVNIAAASLGTAVSSSGNYANSGQHQLKHINDANYGNDKSWISNEKGGGWVQLEFPETVSIDRILWGRDREGKFQDRLPVDYQISISTNGEDWAVVASSADRLPYGTPFEQASQRLRLSPPDVAQQAETLQAELTHLEQLQERLREPKLIYAGVFRDPDTTFLLSRGDPESPQDQMVAAVPAFLSGKDFSPLATEAERRMQLAEWIASTENPLTARVMVNRIWQMHFGRGLVDTPSDFGLNGSRPSHPALLDWLAAEFVNGGWSVKHLHRLITRSAIYQQSSGVNPKAMETDADNRLLWRFPSRRLDAEAIRDCMLAVSGELNLEMGGPGFDFFKTRGGLSGFPAVEEFGADNLRRMIYAHKIRMEPVPVFGVFDCPDAGQPMPQRSRSTTAVQALNLFNSTFVLERATSIADRVEESAGEDPLAQVDALFQLMLGRLPTAPERSACQPVVRQHGLHVLSRVVLNSNEFLFLP
jgi:hypothetical protein